jgi:sec-independent protein translocase protein TatB
MGSLTFSEILTILVVILIIFGPKRLPEFARKVGQFIAWGRKSMQEFTANMQRELGDDIQPLTDLSTEIQGAKNDFTDAVKAVSGTMPTDDIRASEDPSGESDGPAAGSEEASDGSDPDSDTSAST